MTVVQYEQPPPLPPSRPGDEHEPGPAGWVARLRAAAEIAGHIGHTDFVPQALRGNPAAIAAAILYGDEVGLTPMQSLAKIAVIKGRPTLTAEAMRSLVAGAGHELWLEESTVTRAIAAGRRANTDRVGRVTWTLDDAKRAGIAGQQNWRTYPREMLVARATATLARQMFADVIGGMQAAEEVDDVPANGAAPALPSTTPPDDAPPAAEASRTRRRRTPKPAPPPEPEPEVERGPVAPTPPADQQPEPPAAPDPATEPAATGAQKRQIFALMRDTGMTDDRDTRLAYTARLVGRTIGSSNDLTIREAQLVIDDLKRVKELPHDQRADATAGAEAAVLDELDQAAELVTPPVPYNELPPGY